MSKSKDVIEVALKAGADVAMRAEGGPAKIVAYGAAALLTAAGVGVAYAAYLTARSGWHRFFPAGAAQPAFTEPAVNAVEAGDHQQVTATANTEFGMRLAAAGARWATPERHPASALQPPMPALPVPLPATPPTTEPTSSGSMGQQTCGRCAGTGQAECIGCNGRGEQSTKTEHGQTAVFTCDACGGSGKRDCSPCRGTGKS